MPTLSFIVPAYGESPYLEKCIQSLCNQTHSNEIIITTSTPNQLVSKIAESHNVQLLTHTNGGSIAKDWNYAIKQGSGDLIVLAHQDDLYEPSFSSEFIQFYKHNLSSGIIFSQINELVNDRLVKNGKREMVKNILRKFAFGEKKTISDSDCYRRLLGFGCAIPCPAVAFTKGVARNLTFSDQFSVNLDWNTWSDLAAKGVPFGYISKPLMSHRIHPEAETQLGIIEKRREKEDYQLFLRYWPKPIAQLLLVFYKFGY